MGFNAYILSIYFSKQNCIRFEHVHLHNLTEEVLARVNLPQAYMKGENVHLFKKMVASHLKNRTMAAMAMAAEASVCLLLSLPSPHPPPPPHPTPQIE